MEPAQLIHITILYDAEAKDLLQRDIFFYLLPNDHNCVRRAHSIQILNGYVTYNEISKCASPVRNVFCSVNTLETQKYLRISVLSNLKAFIMRYQDSANAKRFVLNKKYFLCEVCF